MEPFVDVAAIAGAPDAVSALRAFERQGVTRAFVGPERLPGDGLAAELRRWEGRVVLAHSVFAPREAPRWNLASADEDLRKQAVAGAAEALRLSADLGAPFYAVHGGWALALTRDADGKVVGPAIPAARARDQLCRSLDRLAGAADDAGIALLVETAADRPAENPAFADPEAMLAVLDRLGAPPLGLLLDLPALVATAVRRNEDPEPTITALRDRAKAIALHHGDGRTAAHRPLGEADVELGLARLAGAGARPVVLRPHDLAPAALRDQLALVAETLAVSEGKSQG